MLMVIVVLGLVIVALADQIQRSAAETRMLHNDVWMLQQSIEMNAAGRDVWCGRR